MWPILLPNPEVMGWKIEEAKVEPILMSIPSVPESCREVIACNCKTGCKTLHCK